MLLIPCPWCGPRDEAEFHYGGQAHVAYPADPAALTDEEWARYLFFRDNPKGPFAERWSHAAGCRRWFNARPRHRAPTRFLAVYRARTSREPVIRMTRPTSLSRPLRTPAGGRIDRDHEPLRVHLRRRRPAPGLPRRHARLGPARQRRPSRSRTSIKLGRPRGIFAAGLEEPNALVQIEEPFPEPMLPATTVELYDGLVASGLPGQGRLATEPDPARYDAVHAHCDVLVVGAGPAGPAAARSRGPRSGARVILADEQPEPGGCLLGHEPLDDAPPGLGDARRRRARGRPRGAGAAPHHASSATTTTTTSSPSSAAPTTSAPTPPRDVPRAGLADPGAPRRPGHRRPRALARLRRQRPAGRHARRARPAPT